MEKKMTTSAINELGEHPSKKVITDLFENQQRNEEAYSGLMKSISKLRQNSATNGNSRLD